MGNLKAKDFSGFWVDGKRDTQGFALGVLAGLQVIKLDETKRSFGERLHERLMMLPRSNGHESFFSGNCISADLKKSCGAAL
ncbi:MAG: hypothetical protein ACK5QT_00840 [Oligoflexia bacterium]